MALATLAVFRSAFREFVEVQDEQVQLFLDLAAASVPAEPWGDHQLEGHLNLAAHLLAMSPYGQIARLDPKSTVTTYGTRHATLEVMVAAGPRVV